MLKSKTIKADYKKQLSEIPETIKNAVISKWCSYMKQIYMCKVMLFRKSMLKTGYPNLSCLIAYKYGRDTVKNIKMQYLTKLLEDLHEGNYEMKVENFVEHTQNGEYIKSIPPLLDPVLCKDLKSFDKAIEAHVKWCRQIWKPTTNISGADVYGEAIPIPEDEEQAKSMYRYLGRDDP